MFARDFDAIPYLEAAHWQRDVGEQVKDTIVIHDMEYPAKNDSAEWCARFFHEQPPDYARPSSCHFAVDNDSIWSCVPLKRIAWHAPGANTHGIGIEHAGFKRFTALDWSSSFCVAMLDLSAWLCAEICARQLIPVDFLGESELVARKPGITTHARVSNAFKRSDHSDPGEAFPLDGYLRQVLHYLPSAFNVLVIPEATQTCPLCDRVFHEPFVCQACNVPSVPLAPRTAIA